MKKVRPTDLAIDRIQGMVAGPVIPKHARTILSGVKSDALNDTATGNVSLNLGFIVGTGSDEEPMKNDIVAEVMSRFAISREAAIVRLVGLRMALHDFFVSGVAGGIGDRSMTDSCRRLVERLDENDSVLMAIPSERLDELLEFQRR
ncbi:hypothetical protein DSM104443_00934 [Usitatibacter rugosus]|uniref:Uncharacterized protein n=1 Tax=Usitatibacter rugosus TaxID=2732067 RepID=A0A6M4GTN8_9PROT|nr:hypothetical protein [Usitatibacter rugosus]QJR09884.1 hypothetical protein DSM104443_00934 [Usitatibacter rugosus]